MPGFSVFLFCFFIVKVSVCELKKSVSELISAIIRKTFSFEFPKIAQNTSPLNRLIEQ